MRQKRAKSYKKQINVYVHTFKFREPYQTLVDAELVLTCQRASFDLVKGLNRTIQAECKPMITQCCMQALYATNNQDAISIAKRFERRRCNHQPTSPEEPARCIESVVNVGGHNKHRYIVASQDYNLRKNMRKVPGVPLVFMNRSVMVMEPLSQASADYSAAFESQKLTHGLNATTATAAAPASAAAGAPAKKRSLGPKAPNPLSVKKKKTASAPTAPAAEAKRRRKHRSGHQESPSVSTES
ncbi:PIN domain-containing protein [[Candida] zeylanoides]